MRQTATVGERGQVTIPKALRARLGIAAGTQLHFEEHDDALIVRRVLTRDPVAALVGLLPRMDVDRSIERLRGPAPDPKRDRGEG
jgi:AbrB family looped-hinge helix DNA binding protein